MLDCDEGGILLYYPVITWSRHCLLRSVCLCDLSVPVHLNKHGTLIYNHFIISACLMRDTLNPCRAEPGYTLPLQTV